jgi:hypothetical protein
MQVFAYSIIEIFMRDVVWVQEVNQAFIVVGESRVYQHGTSYTGYRSDRPELICIMLPNP